MDAGRFLAPSHPDRVRPPANLAPSYPPAGRISSPAFIGRLEELDSLRGALRQAEAGQPSAVLIAGEAGVGKTRLVQQLVSEAGIPEERVLRGGCIPLREEALPYGPIVEALRNLAKAVDPAQLRQLVGANPGELGRLVPELGSRPDHDAERLTAAGTQTGLFELVFGLIGRLSRAGAAVLLIEDLHWADRSTLELLGFLVRNFRREAVLVVLTYRPDELHQGHPVRPWLAELRRLDRVAALDLVRLRREETYEQLCHILGKTPDPELAEAVFCRSEGNPFFSEELLSFLTEAQPGLMPPRLRELPLAKVGSLSEGAREVLRIAAVAGRRPRHQLLARVPAMDEEQLTRGLREAIDHHVLVLESDEESYSFRHALIQQAVYSELLPSERRRLHKQLAEVLTAHPNLGGEEGASLAAEVAHHWYAANERPQALQAAVVAAQSAAEVYAFAEVLAHLTRALELWHRVPDAAQLTGWDLQTLYERAAEAANLVGDHDRAVSLASQALNGVDPAAEPVRAATLWERVGSYQVGRGDYRSAAEAFARAVASVPASPATAVRARALASRSSLAMLCSRYDEAQKLAGEALEVARAAGDTHEEGRVLAVLGVVAAHVGDLEDGISWLREAVAVAGESNEADELGRRYINLTHVLGLAGRLEEAVETSLAGYEASRRLGLERQAGTYLKCNAAWALFKLGRWQEAGRLWREAAAAGMRGVREVSLLVACAELDVAQGRFAIAEERLERAVALLDRASAPLFYRRELLEQRAELALWQGRMDEAEARVAEGVALLSGTDDERFAGRLLMAGLRIHADCAVQGRARRVPTQVAAAPEKGERLMDLVAGFHPHPLDAVNTGLPETPAIAAVCAGEQARLAGTPDPQPWATAASAWDDLSRPYPAAYARWRQAEALLASRTARDDAEVVLRSAYETAARLEAEPLRAEIEALARRSRLDAAVGGAGPGPAVSPVAELGVTARELEVLSLLAMGRSNAQIADALFISAKTASVHVSHLLAKLGVASRGEAAALAHQLGLLGEED